MKKFLLMSSIVFPCFIMFASDKAADKKHTAEGAQSSLGAFSAVQAQKIGTVSVMTRNGIEQRQIRLDEKGQPLLTKSALCCCIFAHVTDIPEYNTSACLCCGKLCCERQNGMNISKK